ncbi:MAG: tRNA (adenosine(37)-N6)-threonylcarbamoyltransferase complex dimerization subunit type 1 TsaB [Rhodospirillales bacterium]|nr:tRNA (adenosine(37)-N6)-threonylcarbamoyltransferase complex dimerization subunit type 1 TsaB [Rhodospirillales bacterium]
MSDFQNILALDSALGGCTAVVVAGARSAVRCEPMARGQAEHLVPFAQEVMEEVKLDYGALDAVLCTIGPGAFTGLRIGMSAARAFGLSLGIPVIGVTTLQAVAMNYVAEKGKSCSVILETKRSDFYIQDFDAQGCAVSEARAALAEVLVEVLPENSVLIGDGAERFINEIISLEHDIDFGYTLPDMVMVAQVLQDRGLVDGVFAYDAQPVYLRDADVSMPKKASRILGGAR